MSCKKKSLLIQTRFFKLLIFKKQKNAFFKTICPLNIGSSFGPPFKMSSGDNNLNSSRVMIMPNSIIFKKLRLLVNYNPAKN